MLVSLWNEAFQGRYPIMPALWEANTAGDPSFRPEDLIVAVEADRPVGFAMTKRFREDVPGCEVARDEFGYLPLLAVAPDRQRQGLGSALLAEAEARLKADGAKWLTVGGSFNHFFPGVPESSPEALAFFRARDYMFGQTVWDVRRDLSAGEPLKTPTISSLASFKLYGPDEREAINDYMEAEFKGRWSRDVAHYLASDKPGAVVALLMKGEIAGFAMLHPPGSTGALRWAGFDPHVAALGPIGISRSLRSHGFGLALLVEGLRWLERRGARNTVIDWTTILGFYAKVGFEPWLSYRLCEKMLK